jgi:cation diffusion facilitator family transporter
VLWRVLAANLLVATAKIVFGYVTGTVSILADGFHSSADTASNAVALIGVRVAGRPPDQNHPYGHRKFETLAAGGVLLFLALVVVELLRLTIGRLLSGWSAPAVSEGSFIIMGATALINLIVIGYERRAGRQLSSEVLLADAAHTQSDLVTSLVVIASLIGVRAGLPWLDAIAGLLVALFIARTGFSIARGMSRILSDTIVIDVDELRRIVLSVPAVLGCHQIRTRGSPDQVFVDLHIWMTPETRLDQAHAISHRVKDEIMRQFPEVEDVVIHLEPAGPDKGEWVE